VVAQLRLDRFAAPVDAAAGQVASVLPLIVRACEVIEHIDVATVRQLNHGPSHKLHVLLRHRPPNPAA
jgi:hypothetical protein